MSNLVEHAKRELELAGLFDDDSDYDGMLGNAVLELIEVFAKQGHSGWSAQETIELFCECAHYNNLTPLTSNSDEWNDVGEYSNTPMWQNKRNPSTFSEDGGKTWYSLDE